MILRRPESRVQHPARPRRARGPVLPTRRRPGRPGRLARLALGLGATLVAGLGLAAGCFNTYRGPDTLLDQAVAELHAAPTAAPAASVAPTPRAAAALAGQGMAFGAVRVILDGYIYEGAAAAGGETQLRLEVRRPDGGKFHQDLTGGWSYWALTPGEYRLERVRLRARKSDPRLDVLARVPPAATPAAGATPSPAADEPERAPEHRPIERVFDFTVRAGEAAWLGRLTLDLDHGTFAIETELPPGFAERFADEYGRLGWPIRPAPLRPTPLDKKE